MTDEEIRSALIVERLPLARGVAAAMYKRVRGLVELEDLYGEACVGLIQAVDRFRPGVGTTLDTWARRRMWGAMLDYLRGLDGLKRGMREQVGSDFQATVQYPQIEAEGKLSFEALLPAPGPGPEERTIQGQLVRLCLEAARSSERQAYVLRRVYLDEEPMRAVAAELGLCESRVSQLATDAGKRVRRSLGWETE